MNMFRSFSTVLQNMLASLVSVRERRRRRSLCWSVNSHVCVLWRCLGQISSQHIGVAALAVNRPAVEEHVVQQISHWFTANTTLWWGGEDIQYTYSLWHDVIYRGSVSQTSIQHIDIWISDLTLKQDGWQDMFRCSMVILASFPTGSPQYVHDVASLLKTEWRR